MDKKLDTPSTLNWLSIETPCLIIHMRASEVDLETLFNK